jgi:L-ascorbate metabolism protein UlaG (beta-lactamase superfamily)
MTFTYYGHACFVIEVQNTKILFDPFITGNPLAKHIDIDSIAADYIVISHAHADHILDAESMAIRTGAKVISAFEVHEWLQAKGVNNTHPMNIGGAWDFGAFRIKCVTAQHSSAFSDGSYGGNPMGFIIYAGDDSFYYSGDTALTMDMQLIARWAQIHFAILPIGDNFTMGIDDAILAANMVATKKIVGVHFDTFGYITIDHNQCFEKAKAAGIELVLPNIGESISL